MAIEITERMIVDYVVNDVDLPEGTRLTSVKFEPRTRKLRHWILEKDGKALNVGDWILNDGSIVRTSLSSRFHHGRSAPLFR